MTVSPKLIEGALGMLARLIPPEEYAKATAAIGELVALGKRLEDRVKAIEENSAEVLRRSVDLGERVAALESAALADSPSFSAMGSERALWMVPGSIEKALAPSKGDGHDG